MNKFKGFSSINFQKNNSRDQQRKLERLTVIKVRWPTRLYPRVWLMNFKKKTMINKMRMIDPKGSRDASKALEFIRAHRSQKAVPMAVNLTLQRLFVLEGYNAGQANERGLTMVKE